MVGIKAHAADSNNNIDKRIDFATGVYGERFLSSLLLLPNKTQSKQKLFVDIRTAAVAASEKKNMRYKLNQLRDPYDPMMKLRFEDSVRADPVVKAALLRKVQFTLVRGRRQFLML
jgi:hypothetical protein